MNLGDRMKHYEKNYSPSQLCHVLPILVRLDGKAFHSFTKGLERPYDKGFNKAMDLTAKFLAESTNARCAYVQSDEITLMYYSDKFESQVFMNAKRDKLNSILASMCTEYFKDLKKLFIRKKENVPAFFDCRSWNVPNKQEAVNVFVWRQQDAVRNSIQSLGQSLFSHKELMGKSCDKIQDMCFLTHGKNWNDLAPRLKRGTFYIRRVEHRKFNKIERDKLPEGHEARKNPDLKVKRTAYSEQDLDILKIQNRQDVLFFGLSPIFLK